MDASDLIQKNKTKAMWVNYKAITQLQGGCVVNCGCAGVSSCIIRYPSFEFRDNIRIGRAACECPSTITSFMKGVQVPDPA